MSHEHDRPKTAGDERSAATSPSNAQHSSSEHGSVLGVENISRVFASLSPIKRSLTSAVAGFAFYGAWAFWANYEHGSMLALKAAYVQGSYSFALTLCMTLLLEAIFRFNASIFNQRLLINWLTITICCAVIFTSSWFINVVAETPEIFRTVILGYIIGAIYSTLYVRGLSRTLD